MKAIRLLPLSLVLAGVTLAGCGSLGEPVRPEGPTDPAARAAWEAERRAGSAAANRAARKGSDKEILDPATATGAPSSTPIGGSNPDPFGKPPL